MKTPLDTSINELSVNELELSVRAYNTCRNSGCDTIGDVFALINGNKPRGMGQKVRQEIKELLESLGFELESTIPAGTAPVISADPPADILKAQRQLSSMFEERNAELAATRQRFAPQIAALKSKLMMLRECERAQKRREMCRAAEEYAVQEQRGAEAFLQKGQQSEGRSHAPRLSAAVHCLASEDWSEKDEAAYVEAIRPFIEDIPRRIGSVAAYRIPVVIKLYFGIDAPSHSYREIAEICGVTRERIRQQLQRGLRLLRHPSVQQQLKEHVELKEIFL